MLESLLWLLNITGNLYRVRNSHVYLETGPKYRRGGGRRPPSLREKPVCGLSSHSAKLRAENVLGRV